MTSTARASGASSSSTDPVDSTFKILVTTDNHLGYMERDPKRGDDSFTTFEEILRAARVEHNVDCMFLGGDLFHENKPSLGCMNRACTLFRKYLWGDKPIEFALRSDPAVNFPTHGLPLANWQDPNMNISLPVFAIHGNHDDPVGGTSSLDILANNGHLNYLGLVDSLEDIVIQPVLLQKGHTYVALYGLGNIRDDRLHRCFRLNKVHFIKPKQQLDANGIPIRWFNILLLHQNRGMRDSRSKSGITEDMLAPFGMQLVIWGNEHEQRMVPEPTPYKYDIVQPGSSILTSITPLECNPKQYGILEVRGTSYRLTPFPLRSVRPVVRRSIELCHDNPRGRTLDEVEDFLRHVVEEMIEEAEQQLAGIPDDVLSFHPNIRFPLMRLSVDFSDPDSAAFPQPNFIRFGQQYMDVVANPGDMLKEIRASDKRSAVSRAAILRRGALGRNGGDIDGPEGSGQSNAGAHGDAFHYANAIPQFRSVDIATKVAEVFSSGIRPPCQVLSEMELSAAVYAFAEKNERNAIEDKINEMLHTTQKMIWKRLGESEDILNPEVVNTEMRRCKIEREKKFFKELEELTAGVEKDGNSGRGRGRDDEDEDNDRKDTGQEDVNNDGRGDRFSRVDEMFDGLADYRRAGGDALDVNDRNAAADALVRQAASRKGVLVDGDMPPFFLDHMKAMLGVDREAGEGEGLARQSRHGNQGGNTSGEEEEEKTTKDPAGYDALLGEDLEELPTDGLDRVTVDEFLTRHMGGGVPAPLRFTGGDEDPMDNDDDRHPVIAGATAPSAGPQRRRAGPAKRAGGPLVVEVDVDESDEDDDKNQNARQGNAHVGQPTAAKRRTERGARGKVAAGAGGHGQHGSGAPGATGVAALNLVSANTTRTGGRQGTANVQPLILTKWGASQNK